MKLEHVEFEFSLVGVGTEMSDLQKQYAEILQREKTIEKTVFFFLKNGWLVNFHQLWELIQKLDSQRVLIPSLKEINSRTPTQHSIQLNFESFCHWPFFRSLPAGIQSQLWNQHQIVDLAPDTKLFSEGDLSRDLWTQISGQSAIFVNAKSGAKKMVGLIDQLAPFGELGFFLKEPRSAEIRTLSQSRFVKIPHTSEISSLVKTESFISLQHRFQVLRAFLQSPVFKHLPESTMDEVIFRGKFVHSTPQQVLFNEGDPGTTCYILIQGQVGIFQNGEIINRLRQGASLGEIALFWSQGRRTATAVSQDNCIFLEIRQQDFYSILASNIELAARLESLAYERGTRDRQRRQAAA